MSWSETQYVDFVHLSAQAIAKKVVAIIQRGEGCLDSFP